MARVGRGHRAANEFIAHEIGPVSNVLVAVERPGLSANACMTLRAMLLEDWRYVRVAKVRFQALRRRGYRTWLRGDRVSGVAAAE